MNFSQTAACNLAFQTLDGHSWLTTSGIFCCSRAYALASWRMRSSVAHLVFKIFCTLRHMNIHAAARIILMAKKCHNQIIFATILQLPKVDSLTDVDSDCGSVFDVYRPRVYML